MNPKQLITALTNLFILCALVWFAALWVFPLVAMGAFYGAAFACFMVWVLWCVVKP